MTAASAIVTVLLFYLAAGLAFAIWFAVRGAGRLDPVAAAGSGGFRLLIVPGAALLWPLLALRAVSKRPSRAEAAR
jgi:hypothetical protein